MELGIDKAKIMQYKAIAEQYLSDPIKLRLFTVGAVLLLGAAAVYLPISTKIDEYNHFLSAAKERNQFIADCEKLQRQALSFRPLIESKPDTNEWISYLLDGLRQFPIKLLGMSAKKQQSVGPYKAAVLEIDVGGPYQELKNYIEWLEGSGKLLRIDKLHMSQGSKGLTMRIIVLGIIPKK
ncbi:MAG: hypothetical protein JW806_02365 [Sedimentisphaerales bacterium]|nr:hypothetical protein [Sedimentisphaerales bacterium]